MNKCILCTFFKMIWNGLWNNVCPSIDKKKEEKKIPFFKIAKESIIVGFLTLLVMAILISFVYSILFFVSWLLGITIQVLFQWIILLVFVPSGFIIFIWMIISDAKIRISCIKAYWRKAKEECA